MKRLAVSIQTSDGFLLRSRVAGVSIYSAGFTGEVPQPSIRAHRGDP
jgi:hypothetical protein